MGRSECCTIRRIRAAARPSHDCREPACCGWRRHRKSCLTTTTRPHARIHAHARAHAHAHTPTPPPPPPHSACSAHAHSAQSAVATTHHHRTAGAFTMYLCTFTEERVPVIARRKTTLAATAQQHLASYYRGNMQRLACPVATAQTLAQNSIQNPANQR